MNLFVMLQKYLFIYLFFLGSQVEVYQVIQMMIFLKRYFLFSRIFLFVFFLSFSLFSSFFLPIRTIFFDFFLCVNFVQIRARSKSESVHDFFRNKEKRDKLKQSQTEKAENSYNYSEIAHLNMTLGTFSFFFYFSKKKIDFLMKNVFFSKIYF